MAKNGYIRLERKLFDSELWTSEPFTPGQAWVDLIAMANYADRDKFYRGTFRRVKRGQIVTSKLALAKRWKWSDGRVRRYLATLEAAEMLRVDSAQNGVLLTVENYSVYQDARRTNSGQNDDQTTSERRTDDEPATTQEINKRNKRNKGGSASAPQPPTVGEVSSFCLENGLQVDAQHFVEYYAALDWQQNGRKIDWQAKCRKWAETEYEKPQKEMTLEEKLEQARIISEERRAKGL